MIKRGIKNIKTAEKYAGALIKSAVEAEIEDMVYNDLLFIEETIKQNKDLESALLNPVVNADDKKDIIRKIFTVHIQNLTIDFMLLLIDNNRLNILNEVVNQYTLKHNELRNLIKPLIISAIELDEGRKAALIEKLEYKLSKRVLPEYEINPDIIGGLIIELGDKIIDCSLKTKFNNMKKQLTGGNRYDSN